MRLDHPLVQIAEIEQRISHHNAGLRKAASVQQESHGCNNKQSHIHAAII
jgi:hypothetical protein